MAAHEIDRTRNTASVQKPAVTAVDHLLLGGDAKADHVGCIQSTFGNGTVEPVPFFIHWAQDSVHPAQDSPQGCELKSLEFAHPTPDALVRAWIRCFSRSAVSRYDGSWMLHS
jgi:hypothetical protein